ncbi:LodA/GoxA family CTQ-dependent oxidase [Saccharothrix syringae]|uniref:L-lysine 6-oxidase n=1 Tax=Saccharothrix syringae TaxID=103733 RepID=A0A5Q0GYL2_SACSY|nr:LodA/GoxA family CTQ-dependent oxidase [Saccharothrix syringae]QFZ19091.1 hypothetical protein EKG83_18020 [Saccharothrix syringae]
MADPRFRIFPAIGIARLGDSDEFYLPPEEPGGLPVNPDGAPFTAADFRDAAGRLRKQAALFRVHAGDTALSPGTEVGDEVVDRIEWTAYPANKKASWYEFRTSAGERGYPVDHPLRNAHRTGADRYALVIDPGPRTVVSGPGGAETAEFDGTREHSSFPPPLKPEGNGITTLGRVVADPGGRLLFLGGNGKAGTSRDRISLPNYANNDDWWDDTSDGPVTATVWLTGPTGEQRAVEVDDPAWVIVAPPAYAPQIVNLISLYDTMFDVAVRHQGLRPGIYRDGQWQGDYEPDFDSEIRPVLERVSKYPWVVAIPPKVHTFDWERLGDPDPRYDQLRRYYVEVLRAPEKQNTLASRTTGYRTMPYQPGDDALGSSQQAAKFLTLTPTQYFLLRQWGEGRFTRTGRVAGRSELEQRPGHRATRADLENCAGGAFSPGIEMTWLCRITAIYAEPFRIRHAEDIPTEPGRLDLGADLTHGLGPGDVTKFMALPWHADFNLCSVQPVDDHFVWWWPAQRPIFVYAMHETDRKWRHVTWVGTARDQTADDFVGYADSVRMVHDWSKLGFVLENPQPAPASHDGTVAHPEYVEVQRLLPRDGYLTEPDLHPGPIQDLPGLVPPQDRAEPGTDRDAGARDVSADRYGGGR